jgi:hypothetical protein
MICFSAAWLNGAGLVISALAAVVIAVCTDRGVYVAKNGSVSMIGWPADMPADEQTRRNRWRYKKNTFGAPIGWMLFAAGFLLQALALSLTK